MRFWDSSALVPLVLTQPRTERAKQLLKEDPELLVWWGSAVECASAIARLHRDGHLTKSAEQAARALLDLLRSSWFEVQPTAFASRRFGFSGSTPFEPRMRSNSPRRSSGPGHPLMADS